MSEITNKDPRVVKFFEDNARVMRKLQDAISDMIQDTLDVPWDDDLSDDENYELSDAIIAEAERRVCGGGEVS